KTPYANFCWCPSKECQGGLVALNKRLKHEWQIQDRLAEGIILGIVDDIPEDSRPFKLMKFPKDRYPVRGCRILRRQISVIGGSGPYVMLAVCTANSDHSNYAVPTLNRMIMHSIVSWRSLIPVNSEHEREIARTLIKNRISFVKPLFGEGRDRKLKPDFILPDKCILDIGRLKSADYADRRIRIQRRMESYYKLPVITFDVNEGQKLEAFGKKLLSPFRSTQKTGKPAIRSENVIAAPALCKLRGRDGPDR
ncbi:MAG: hypothetical protein JSW39_16030, partial [Desulfobacterales bacterium]